MFCLLFCNLTLFAQLSPGELSEFHSHLEGLSNCVKCHELGKSVTNKKCLDCHETLNSEIKINEGFHSSKKVKGKECIECHSEHNGKKFEIVHFDKKSFNHQLTGFELIGAHTKLECEKCHTVKNFQNKEIKKKKFTFLGLNKKCSTCHEDPHNKTLGENCSKCHTNLEFKGAKLFNHNDAKFKLKGKHLKVECIKCHPGKESENKSKLKFKGIKFSSCSNCHEDKHRGKFGKKCSNCHVETGFNKLKSKDRFNHKLTGFPLEGKHKFVNCNKCHKNGFWEKLRYNLCSDCHEDFHKKEISKEKDCSNCHVTNGFNNSIFSLEMHNKTEFKLTGSHLAVPCFECHKKEDKWKFKSVKNNCSDCHDNIHGSEISKQFMGNLKCVNCHNTEMWNKVKFDHNRTNFALKGKHSNILCNECHKKAGDLILFKSLKTSCIQCHEDNHVGQFNIDGKTNCERCHNFDNWRPEKFNHDKTRFSLTGAHKELKCEKCHKPVKKGNQLFIEYKIEKTKCADCHL